MSMKLDILPHLIKPADYIAHFILICMGSANIHKKNVLGTALVANGGNLTDSSSPTVILAPDQAFDVLSRSTSGQSFRVDRQYGKMIYLLQISMFVYPYYS